jgi:hypothetical protein
MLFSQIFIYYYIIKASAHLTLYRLKDKKGVGCLRTPYRFKNYVYHTCSHIWSYMIFFNLSQASLKHYIKLPSNIMWFWNLHSSILTNGYLLFCRSWQLPISWKVYSWNFPLNVSLNLFNGLLHRCQWYIVVIIIIASKQERVSSGSVIFNFLGALNVTHHF